MKDFILGDCMEGMREFPDNFFDLAIVDPNYGIGEDGGKQRTRGSKKLNGVKKNWDKEPPKKEYFDELIRVSKNQIIWGANHFISRIPYDSPCWVIWDKLDYGSDFADFEMAWTSFKTAAKSFRYSRQANQGRKNNPRIHPTQKPVQLYKWLLRNYAQSDFKILSTHVGSASDLIAFEDFGCDYVGYEIDKDYYESALKRLNQHKSQLRIF